MLDELRQVVAKACTEEATETPDGDVIENLILNEFVIVASRVGWDGEGDNVTQVVMIPVDGPDHRIMGLLRNATLRMDADVLDSYRT